MNEKDWIILKMTWSSTNWRTFWFDVKIKNNFGVNINIFYHSSRKRILIDPIDMLSIKNAFDKRKKRTLFDGTSRGLITHFMHFHGANSLN
ncbi:hypothetical protein BpHYR1_028865 [Brachionus plicatilis]|uniref:Uncharacterized protein n=1 Tax=Brachionus plicatilis TaxID=10195 RepID=A0A3M7T6G0_BRAPC|nr:hypothetical protein BpHYR1_028865 [Brachionus plicatilis]